MKTPPKTKLEYSTPTEDILLIVTGTYQGSPSNLIVKLPDGFQERAAADIFILSDQSYAFRSSRRPDEPVGGIARVVFWKLRSQRCNLDCDRLHYDPDGF